MSAQEIDGIQLGEKNQKSTYKAINDHLYQVVPVEDEESEVICGVMYLPVDADSKIPTTLSRSACETFELEIQKQYAIEFDSVLNYTDATMKFYINKERGIEYEFNREKMGEEYDTFFVVWYDKLRSKKKPLHVN
ncbi:hypothetical protein [Flammeovirga aprica]|uniref:Uncharacterized protein n=1 Tax=Flammeovirga aprica JL-4 TaxID=694437 RepID=A0A7X9RVX6_9BACT|nr:hypothetical protein [Flammeovirga aprica]NME69624.1 hypothetical protein [Flammeovirga aprica JL-4]